MCKLMEEQERHIKAQNAAAELLEKALKTPRGVITVREALAPNPNIDEFKDLLGKLN